MAQEVMNGMSGDGWVEILGDNGAHYKAYVMDVMDGQTNGHEVSAQELVPQLTLAFESNWHRMETFPITRVRLPPMKTSHDTTPIGYKEGQEVEVLSAAQTGEHQGFWKAVIKEIKGDFYVVSCVTTDTNESTMDPKNYTLDDIYTADKIRAINPNPYLSVNPFFKLVIEVPNDLIAKNLELIQKSQTHEHFRRALAFISVTFVDHLKSLVCIWLAPNPIDHWIQITKRRALVLSEIHFRSLRQMFEMLTNLKGLREQMNSIDEVVKHNDNEFELFVKVEEHLIGLAIGTKGAHLKRVLSVPGIVSINNNDGVFRIIATRRDSCLIAKRMLQIMEKTVEVPRDIVGHVIGRGGQYAQELTDKSGLILCRVKDDKDSPLKPSVTFRLTGTSDALENAELILQFNMSCIRESIEFERNHGLNHSQ